MKETPRYIAISNDLRSQIESGKWGPGEKIPSERELAKRYDVVRATAAKALKTLETEGSIEPSDRSGWRVRAHRRLLRLGAERYSNRLREETGLSPYRAEVQKQGKEARVECTSIQEVDAPDVVSVRLNLSAERVVRRENWYFADDEPVQVGVTFIPTSIAGTSVLATSAAMGKGSLYGRFEDLGHRITSIREEISSRMPTLQERTDLQIPSGVPVIDVMHTGIDQDERPFEVTQFTMRADLNGLDYTIRIED